VKHLLEKGAVVGAQDKEKSTPLHTACVYGRRECVQALLNACFLYICLRALSLSLLFV
jgi:ankyrin repeat protein